MGNILHHLTRAVTQKIITAGFLIHACENVISGVESQGEIVASLISFFQVFRMFEHILFKI